MVPSYRDNHGCGHRFLGTQTLTTEPTYAEVDMLLKVILNILLVPTNVVLVILRLLLKLTVMPKMKLWIST